VDITQLILDDQHEQRRLFAILEQIDRTETAALSAVWDRLAALLEVHAEAEEQLFYPELLRVGKGVGSLDPAEETEDAIGDHNDIRDGGREAAQHPIGSPQWWDAVRQTRVANSNHMAEEEDDALPDFRRNAPLSVREDLAHRFLKFKTDHADARDLDTSDKDPEGYVNSVSAQISAGETGSLGIGSLKGR